MTPDGNLVSAKDLESKNEQFTYTNNDLTKYVTPGFAGVYLYL
jgi:hypothetical protein